MYADRAARSWRHYTRALRAAGMLLPVGAIWGAGMLCLRGMRYVEQDQRAALLWGHVMLPAQEEVA